MAESGDNVIRFGKPANANANSETPPESDVKAMSAELAAELRDCVELAESGELASVAVAMVHANGGIATSWFIAPTHMYAAVAATASLQRDVLGLLDE